MKAALLNGGARRTDVLARALKTTVRGRSNDGRVLACALLASLALHVAIAIALFGTVGTLALRASDVTPHTRDEIVAISNPVSIEHRAAQAADPALARFSLQMRGRRASLRRGQGLYAPLSSWNSGGTRYYRVAYAFVYRDGAYESGVVPWPVTFARGTDPFAGGKPFASSGSPLPGPPRDFMPPGTLGKALRAYFPQLLFED